MKDLESTKLNICKEMEQNKREHAKEISHLQTEIDESKRIIEQQRYHNKGLEHEKEKLEEVLEENKENTLALEVIKEETIELNEKIRSEH
jgi:hypothetical protein